LKTALYVWLALLNLLLLILMGVDKGAAKRRNRRIPESTLLALALLGGSAGGLLGMFLFRHKTRKAPFSLGFPLILLCQLAFGYVLFLR